MNRMSLFVATVALVAGVGVLPVPAQSTLETLFTAKEHGRRATLSQCHADLAAWKKAMADNHDYLGTLSTEELYRRFGEASTCDNLLFEEAHNIKDPQERLEAEQRADGMVDFLVDIIQTLLSRAEVVMIDHHLGQEFLANTDTKTDK
jgi:hypothetical protein